ncbi:MAG: hypothetical protein EAZ55_14050 [Cytophagales bacterium]|nr:MAG: hypothetical protein EAZ55_14050 [Cytophagales bacterium]
MPYKYTLLFWFVFCSKTVFSQFIPRSVDYAQEALRYSTPNFGVTARYQGLAGAQTAIGGDMGSLTGNPAGLGFFKRAEISFSPTFYIGGSFTDYNGQLQENYMPKMLFDNAGLVFSYTKDDEESGALRGVTVGFSYSRINNYNRDILYNGENTQNSLLDAFLAQSNGSTTVLNFENQRNSISNLPALAYHSYLIRPTANTANTATYFHDFQGQKIQQSERILSEGRQSQWTLGTAVNISDRLYIGLSLGIQGIKTENRNEFTERSLQTNVLNNYTFTQRNEVSGIGFNSTLGLIFRALNMFRVGVSATTPTYYEIYEQYGSEMSANFNNLNWKSTIVTQNNQKTNEGEFEYYLQTPWRFNVGSAIFLGKLGFLTADIEYVDFSSIFLRQREDKSLFNAENQRIIQRYQPTFNYRMGAELRYRSIRLRGGIALYGDPTDAAKLPENFTRHLTAGIGLRNANFFLDLALRNTYYIERYEPYQLNSNQQPRIEIIHQEWYMSMSMGYFF